MLYENEIVPYSVILDINDEISMFIGFVADMDELYCSVLTKDGLRQISTIHYFQNARALLGNTQKAIDGREIYNSDEFEDFVLMSKNYPEFFI